MHCQAQESMAERAYRRVSVCGGTVASHCCVLPEPNLRVTRQSDCAPFLSKHTLSLLHEKVFKFISTLFAFTTKTVGKKPLRCHYIMRCSHSGVLKQLTGHSFSSTSIYSFIITCQHRSYQPTVEFSLKN